MADLLSMCANDLELNDVYEGDCLELLQDVETGSIHLAFADPPFNIGFEYDVYQDRRSADEYLTWCRQWMKELDRGDTLIGKRVHELPNFDFLLVENTHQEKIFLQKRQYY